MTKEDIKTIIDIVHKTIYGFFDVCGDDEETPMTDKDKMLLKVNKALCNNIKALEQQPCEDKGEVSDGYHTFNQLYHQRAMLFATLVNEHPDISWKSFKHSDGHYCFDEDGEMFIVGIDTPEGSYTYHYHKKYWDLFKCKELECGKEWDGHTEKDVTRLLSLPLVPPTRHVGRWLHKNGYYECSRCACLAPSVEFADGIHWKLSHFCPDCGADMRGEKE